MLSDLHIHSTYSDGRLSIANISQQVREQGYDAIGITDHIGKSRELDMRLESFQDYIADIGRQNRNGLIVLKGIEIGVWDKDILDKLGQDRLQQLDYLLFEHAEDRVGALAELSRQLRKPIGLAHPNFSEIPWEKIGSVFVELNTSYMSYEEQDIARKNFRNNWLSVGSDTHYTLETARVRDFHEMMSREGLRHVLDREDFKRIAEEARARQI